jgi:hypothetical protein
MSTSVGTSHFVRLHLRSGCNMLASRQASGQNLSLFKARKKKKQKHNDSALSHPSAPQSSTPHFSKSKSRSRSRCSCLHFTAVGRRIEDFCTLSHFQILTGWLNIVLALSLMAWKHACQLSPVSRIAYHSDLESLFRSQALFNIQEGCARGGLILILVRPPRSWKCLGRPTASRLAARWQHEMRGMIE